MKFLDLIAKVMGGLWKFVTNTFSICLVSAIAVFVIAIFMPDEVLQAIEIVKGLFP